MSLRRLTLLARTLHRPLLRRAPPSRICRCLFSSTAAVNSNPHQPPNATTRTFPTTSFSDLPPPVRSHLCNSLPSLLSISPLPSPATRVSLCGWLQSLRLIGDLFFGVLRDHSGTTQLVWTREDAASSSTPHFPLLSSLTLESVVAVTGLLRPRPPPDPHHEVRLLTLHLLSPAATLPFPLHPPLPSLDVRLTHRHLDLRRPYLQRLLLLRSSLSHALRRALSARSFTEVETPVLFRSSPEGAREFLVPTRSAGQMYALPQSPQQMKQMLMVAGVDRYYQLARCFRDEGQRADRQPEFTQLDLEMAFVRDTDVRDTVEDVVKTAIREVVGWEGEEGRSKWPVMSYWEAMERYGVDKPDVRFGMTIHDLRALVPPSPPAAALLGPSTTLRGLRAAGLSPALSRREMEALQAAHPSVLFVRVPSMSTKAAQWKCPPPLRALLQSADGDAFIDRVRVEMGLQEGDVLVVAMGRWMETCSRLGRARLAAKDLLVDKGMLAVEREMRMLWVVEFPLLDVDVDAVEERWLADGNDGSMTREDAKLTSMHHPFTAPHPSDTALFLPLLSAVSSLPPASPLPLSALRALSKVRGQHYDLVCNGVELAGGSIRIHSSALQSAVLSALAAPLGPFQGLLTALDHGAPPHGGVAMGFDRFVAMVGGYVEWRTSGSDVEGRAGDCLPIRDVIAFPKTTTGKDLLFGAPSSIINDQLAEYHITLHGAK